MSDTSTKPPRVRRAFVLVLALVLLALLLVVGVVTLLDVNGDRTLMADSIAALSGDDAGVDAGAPARR